MGEYLLNHVGIFDTGDHLHGTLRASDLPGNRMFGVFPLTPSGGGDQHPVLTVGSEHTVKFWFVLFLEFCKLSTDTNSRFKT
jgi:hypothetical protein